MSEPEPIRSSELIPLYRLLLERQEELTPSMVGLLTRLERRLFECLSIEEIEQIPDLSDAGVADLSEKL